MKTRKKVIITKEKPTDVNKEWDNIKTAIEQSTELLEPTKHEKKDWFDDKCKSSTRKQTSKNENVRRQHKRKGGTV